MVSAARKRMDVLAARMMNAHCKLSAAASLHHEWASGAAAKMKGSSIEKRSVVTMRMMSYIPMREPIVVVDVEGQSARSLNLLLDWVTRSDVSTRIATDPVRTPKSVPLSHAVHHTEAPDANSNSHSSDTRTRVTDVLRSLGVPASCWEDTLYFGCLKGMALTRSEVAKRHTGTS